MKRYIIHSILVITSFVFLIFTINRGVKYNTVIVNMYTFENIKADRHESPIEAEIYFNDEKLVFGGNDLYYSLIENRRSSYNPSIKIVAHEPMKFAVLGGKIRRFYQKTCV